mmetsp:Transcript_34600/g.103397  ORF Transcript_34600/g.103397 Transcript_34600/m.103397 type:complete len:214 (-) Transcript_34600:231-872(-)
MVRRIPGADVESRVRGHVARHALQRFAPAAGQERESPEAVPALPRRIPARQLHRGLCGAHGGAGDCARPAAVRAGEGGVAGEDLRPHRQAAGQPHRTEAGPAGAAGLPAEGPPPGWQHCAGSPASLGPRVVLSGGGSSAEHVPGRAGEGPRRRFLAGARKGGQHGAGGLRPASRQECLRLPREVHDPGDQAGSLRRRPLYPRSSHRWLRLRLV